jgi:hypothetical protein
MAQTIYPRDAISPQNALYIRREHPTPWLNIISGHFFSRLEDSGIRKGAFGLAGKVVPYIAAAASGSEDTREQVKFE